MVENSTFSDTLASVTSPTSAEHGKALEALQSEIDYHRKKVGNGTYVDKAISYIYDGGKPESLQKLELAYNQEKENPDTLSRQDVTKLVKDDQKTVKSDFDYLVGLTSTGLAFFGGSKGKMAATALIALDTMHPNDSSDNQVLEAIAGVGLGTVASRMFDKGMTMQNQLLGGALTAVAYPFASNAARNKWPNAGVGDVPDVEQIYNAPVTKTTYSPYSNLTPMANSEWNQFDFLKK